MGLPFGSKRVLAPFKVAERAAALEPDRAKHYYNIAALQRSLGDIEQAEANLHEVSAANTDLSEASLLTRLHWWTV